MLREGIEAHDHPKDRAALMRLLVRRGRVDEAVETGRPTYEYHDCWNFLHWALELLVDDGRPDRALELLDGLTVAYVEEHPDQVRHLRLWLLGEAGRCAEGISEATALNKREPGRWDTVLARLLERDDDWRRPSHCSAPPLTTWRVHPGAPVLARGRTQHRSARPPSSWPGEEPRVFRTD